MRPGALHRICAHPEIISCVLGACALDTAAIYLLTKEAPLSAFAADWQALLWLVVALIPTSLLGFLLGIFTCWPLVRPICSRINGAPLEIGDQVLILSGPKKGDVAEVYEISLGQGRWSLARLNLGPECKKHFRDIYEQYSLLKIVIRS